MTPTTPLPRTPSPRPKFPNVRSIIGMLLTVLVIGGFIGTFLLLNGKTHPHTVATGLDATATPVSDTPLITSTPSLDPTSTTVVQTGDVRVTQNQDMRPSCKDDPAPYTVVLFNAGKTSANWHVEIPLFIGAFSEIAPTGLATRSLSPLNPHGSTPYWASVQPQDGSIAPGQTASFVMTPLTYMPCGSTAPFKASVKLSFPSGASQPPIPLTYAGTGLPRQSNVALVSGSQSITEPCPTGGVTPASFTFAIKNFGDGIAYPSLDTYKDEIAGMPWATFSVTYDPSNLAVPTWIYPDETWTVTITPSPKVQCGTTYHLYLYINNTQGVGSTMTFTDTFQ